MQPEPCHKWQLLYITWHCLVVRQGETWFSRRVGECVQACRTLAYPYGAMVSGPPNFGGLRPKCLILSLNLGPLELTCMVPWPTEFCPSWSRSDPTFTENQRSDLPSGRVFMQIGTTGSLVQTWHLCRGWCSGRKDTPAMWMTLQIQHGVYMALWASVCLYHLLMQVFIFLH